MKSRFFPFAAAFILCVSLSAGALRAQDESENNSTSGTTYDSTGIVTSVDAPSTITVASRRGPFTYALDQDLHVIGPDARPRKISQVRVGQQVTVYYYKHIGTETAARIVVLKENVPHGK